MAKKIYDNKDFKPEQLAEPEFLAMISNTYKVLTTTLHNISKKTQLADYDIKHEIPLELKAALEQNAFMFSGFKIFHQANEISSLLKGEDGGFKPYSKFAQEVKSIDDKYNKNYLRAEYTFATQSTLSAMKWQDIEKDGDNYNLQYRSAGDERVREEHAALNNTTLPPSDPFWSKYYPPNGWNCRCTAVQVRKGKYPESDPKTAMTTGDRATTKIGKAGVNKAAIFRFNPGKEMKLMPPKHPYLPKYKDCADCEYNKQLAWLPNREFCRACKELYKCYQIEEGKNTKNLSKYSVAEKKAIYNKDWEEQLETLVDTEKGFLKQHILKDKESMDYERVKRVGLLFSKNNNVTMLPEIHKSETKLRNYLGFPETANPDLNVNGFFVDVKSPFNTGNIVKNANKSQKQSSIVCITDDHCVIKKKDIYKYAEKIFNDSYYKHDDVWFCIDNNLIKIQRPKKE